MALLEKIYELFAADKAGTSSRQKEPPSRLMEESSAEGPYADLDKIRMIVKEFMEQCSRSRWAFERLWFKSVLFYFGKQWISWDRSKRFWGDVRLKRKWVPKPVTNYYASTLDSVAAAIQTFKVQPSVWPATSDADDVATANVADRIIPVIDNEVEIETVREAAAAWVTLNADAILFPHYDLSDTKLGSTKIQSYRCQVCQVVNQPAEFDSGACPSCGAPAMTEPAMDEAGNPVEQDYPVGRLKVGVYSPIQVFLNMDITDIEEHREFCIIKNYDLDTVKGTWPDSGKNIAPDSHATNKTAIQFMEAMAYITDDGPNQFIGRPNAKRITLFQYCKMPDKQFPDGLAVMMGSDDTVLEVGPYPFFDESPQGKQYYNPLIHLSFRKIPSRLYAKTPAYDLLSKQEQINRLDSLIEASTMKGVYGTWLLPTGSSISNIQGDPAQVIRWTPTGTNGAKPEVVTTNPVPLSLFEQRKIYKDDIEELAGTFDAMKGQVPKGVSAGYAIQLLMERSYGRFGIVFGNWEKGFVKLYNILIKLARTYWTEDRLKRVRGQSGQWEVEKFKGADLKGAVDMMVEGGTSKPRSKLAEQALVESLAKLGVINPADPKQQFKIVELFGMQHILGGVDEDKREAAREWDSFLNNPGVPFDVHQMFDNHLIHIMDHQERGKTDAFRELPKEIQVQWEQHILQHMQTMMAQMPQASPAPASQASKMPGAPAGSKANEMGDPTMRQVREGGNAAMGSPPGGA